jgi:hypothetical protein
LKRLNSVKMRNQHTPPNAQNLELRALKDGGIGRS